ncbi:MAG: VCBS repeat-containing protein, partial [Candidatus Sulfotelmatobacter sp.]
MSAVDAAQNLIQPRGATAATSGLGNGGFLARPSLPAGFIPTAITNADFNGDGKMDFAVSNGGDNTIYVFLGNGDGTFKVPEILYTQGQSPNWITAVTLRKNGPADLAVTDGDSNTVEVFLGNGDGTFQPSTQTSLPQIPTFILAADANNDGNQDLVVGLTVAQDLTQPQFEILLGNGSGGFSGTLLPKPIYFPDGDIVPTTWIAAGDLNNDGYIDFVVTANTEGFFMPYLNQAGKTFPLGDYLGYNDGPVVVGVGDMNEDGCLDAIQLGGYGLVTVALGTCDGNFAENPNPTAMLGDLDPAIEIADVNGDGHLDVLGSAVFYPLEDNPGYGNEAGYYLSVLDGDGKGDLGVATIYRGGTDNYSFIVADFTGDGFPEILTASSLENQVSFFLNDGTGKYGDPQGATIGYTVGPSNAPDSQSPLETADLNGDGKPDLLLVEYNQMGGGPPQLTALMNDGKGNFLPPVRTTIPVGEAQPVPVFISAAFRSTAEPDVIYINTYDGSNSVFYVEYFPGNGDGTFGTPVTVTTLPNPQRVVAGDFNSDGKMDFAVLGTDLAGLHWEVDVFLGNGNGTFNHLAPQLSPILVSQPFSPQQLFAVDLNHDRKLDLLFGLNSNGGWVVSGDDLIEALGNGDGTFQTPTILFSHFGAVAVADVNLDGYPDLIQNRDPNGDFATAGLLYQPGITVYLGSADGTFQQQPSYDLPGLTAPSLSPARVGDFNGDGIPDIAVYYWPAPSSVHASLSVLQGVGDGTFIVTGHNYQLQAESYPVVGADFNGDGATDLMELTGLTSSYSTIPAAAAPALDIALDSSPILGTTGKATVTLDLPATSSQTVTLSASDPAIELPASVHFSAGQQTQGVTFTLGAGFDTTHVFALYATLGTQTAVAYGTKPNPNLTVGVAVQLSYPLDPLSTNVSVEPGESFPMVFGLTSEAGYSGTFSSLQCTGLPTGASCTFDAPTIPIFPGGSGSVGFTISTSTATPFGTENVTVSGTDGFVTGAASFKMGIGDFSLSINPSTLVSGPSGDAVTTLTSAATNGLNESLTFTCSGLPAGTQCGAGSNPSTSSSTDFGVNHNQLAANDYPFQITGTADIISHTINAILRVGDYTASLDNTTATLSAGQSATFNVTLTSVNHYASSITVSCSYSASDLGCAASPSPATLTDDGTTVVQLTLTNTTTVPPTIRRAASQSSGKLYLLASLLPLSLLLVRERKHLFLTLIILAGLAATLSCGGSGVS